MHVVYNIPENEIIQISNPKVDSHIATHFNRYHKSKLLITCDPTIFSRHFIYFVNNLAKLSKQIIEPHPHPLTEAKHGPLNVLSHSHSYLTVFAQHLRSTEGSAHL